MLGPKVYSDLSYDIFILTNNTNQNTILLQYCKRLYRKSTGNRIMGKRKGRNLGIREKGEQ